MSERIMKFLHEVKPPTPCVVIDLDIVKTNYQALKENLPTADIFYAVKANPGTPVIKTLASMGSCFDTASIPEIQLCISQGVSPDRISFGNTIKKESDIRLAFEYGINLFAFDSYQELEKIARQAPGSKVFCRILTSGTGAEWPLSRKFGCSLGMAIDLLLDAKRLGLNPYGVSFHVGSQQLNISQWQTAISEASTVFKTLKQQGIELQMVNMGGGFPATYSKAPEDISVYTQAIKQYIEEEFGSNWPRIIIEPGRSMVGDAGIIQTEVVLVSRKSYEEDEPRWVFLDIGKFGGLPETMDESIKYRLRTDKLGTCSPVVLAGPTCDSADILYEKAKYELPDSLEPGDKIQILSTGAYTTTYSSVFFNGFAPLKDYYI